MACAVTAAMLTLLLLLAVVHHTTAQELPAECSRILESSAAAAKIGQPRSAQGSTTETGRKCKYPVKNFVVLGERNSGTNYLSQLLKKNVKEKTVNFLHQFPKHWSPSDYDTAVPKHTLYILSLRNPYDWLVSMHRQCYCCEGMSKPKGVTFQEFLRKPYTVDTSTKQDCPPGEGLAPGGEPLADMMALRTAKMHMHLHMGMAARPYFVTVRMEELWCRENPAAWLQERLADFCFDWKEDLSHVVQHDARQWLGAAFDLRAKFERSWYFNPDRTCKQEGAATLRTIHKGLHTKLERRMGYHLIQCPLM